MCLGFNAPEAAASRAPYTEGFQPPHSLTWYPRKDSNPRDASLEDSPPIPQAGVLLINQCHDFITRLLDRQASLELDGTFGVRVVGCLLGGEPDH